jgi:hypothetical protein
VNAQLFERGGSNVWMAKEVRSLYAQPFSLVMENFLRPGDQADVTEDELLADAEQKAS